TALALIPLALAGDKPGNEIQSPMAVVILGGLLSSILLNIFVVPAIYMVYEKRRDRLETANNLPTKS
ncbi:MAG TPA: efflux RND transporter permease subunit, partial [Tenuifilaceae bacterium]|nr:efflux RND transporter permease subunit [Tenuifilaceae bacterium]